MLYRTILSLQIILLFCVNGISGTDLKYKVSDIPEDLRKNAKAVVRKNNIVFRIANLKKATKTVDYAITILNNNGNSLANFTEFYDKFTRIRDIKICIYNGDGVVLKKYSQGEVSDFSAISGFSIYEDNRVKFLEPAYRTPPYTMEYSYEVEYDGMLTYPGFNAFPDYNVSVQEATYTLVKPELMKVRYLEQNIPEKTQKEISPISFFWKVINLQALKKEEFAQSFLEIIPRVFTAPSDFEISGYKGNSDSWETFGSWINTLNTDKDKLPDETVDKLNKIIANAKDDYDKVAILYKYMQDKTRYVSIQIGIGSWQPFDASTIDRVSYGDCKALANYMKSLLKSVGIKSYYTLVRAGEEASPLMSDFPSNQFNHAILCVPIQNDTLWLECTNQQMPCGYLGKFTDDRQVLAIDENGGHLIHTKIYKASENVKSQITSISLNSEGDGTAKKVTNYTGTYFDDLYKILFSDAADKKKLVTSQIRIPSFELLGFNHVIDKKRLPKVTETLDLQLSGYATRLNNMLIVPVNEINKFPALPVQNTKRKSNILIRRAFQEKDSIILNLPDEYSIDKLPEGNQLKSVFGEYSAEIIMQGKSILYIRNLQLNKGNYEPDSYNDFLAFFEKVTLWDNIKLVLKKKA
jgi:transglutaminase-like putative cysteine protease